MNRGTTVRGREGLAWLGRRPENQAGLLLRALVAAGRFVAFRVFDLRVRVEGLSGPIAGGSILACAAHRSWIDAPLLVGMLPLEPRLWYLGSGPSTFRARWRERLLHRIGGILPVTRGGTDVEVHVDSARAVLDGGALFGIFPEGSRSGEAMTLQPFRRGVGLIALRTGAPIVPVALGGTTDLYRGRRLALRILSPVSALDLAGIHASPVPRSAAEIDAARRIAVALRELLAPHVAELAAWSEDPAGHPRRWRWLRTLFR